MGIYQPRRMLRIEAKEDWNEFKERISYALEVKFYEIIGTGRQHLQESFDLLR